MKIYTRSGDTGTTSLFDGQRVTKNDQRIALVGELDELNAYIGLLLYHLKQEILPEDNDAKLVESITANMVKMQQLLFTFGAEVANPRVVADDYYQSDEFDKSLEQTIDEIDKNLEPLKNFILPQGCRVGSLTHVVRSVCRRVERSAVAFENSNPDLLKTLNRFSDFLFMAARFFNKKQGYEDTVWQGS